jgi:uncharacterized protein YuzE
MRIDYDAKRGLLYVRLRTDHGPIIRSETVVPGVFADFDEDNNLVGIEVIDAKLADEAAEQFEVALRPAS